MSNANPLSNQTTSRKAKTMTTETAQTDPMIDHDVEVSPSRRQGRRRGHRRGTVMRQEAIPRPDRGIDNIASEMGNRTRGHRRGRRRASRSPPT